MKAHYNKQEVELEDKQLSRAIEDFWELKMKADNIKAEMEPLKVLIADKARMVLKKQEVATLTFEQGDLKVKVTFGWDVKIKDEEELRKLLGDKFDVLVKHKEEYTPERKLKEMALSDDGLKSCLSVKEKRPSVAVAR